MHSKKDCLQLIRSVRKVASDPDSAYLLRTRLKRALLSVSRLAAYCAGIKDLQLPGKISIPDDVSGRSRNLIDTCNGLLENTRKLCQPSEALDTRWNSGWVSVLDELRDLEKQLIKWPDSF